MLHQVTTGAGAQTMMLVHGWTCDHHAMAPVARALADKFACVSVDLPGHGASPKSDDYGIDHQARALLEVTPDGAILVGHSMGGQIAVAAAAMAPEKIAAIILLDPAQIIPLEKSRAFGEGLKKHLDEKSPRDVLAAFVGNQDVQVADAAERAACIAQMLTTDADVIRSAWHAIVDWQGADAFARVTCPVLVIAIDKPVNKLSDLARANKNVMTGQVVGSGHSLQFEVMPQVTPMIERFLQLNGLMDG